MCVCTIVKNYIFPAAFIETVACTTLTRTIDAPPFLLKTGREIELVEVADSTGVELHGWEMAAGAPMAISTSMSSGRSNNV